MKQITDIHCSKLSRPMTCAGSLFFDQTTIQEVSDTAKEGTAAGELLALYLNNSQNIPLQATNGIPFDNDMKFYMGEIAWQIEGKAETKVLCETKIDWKTRSGIWIKGKYDVSFVVGNTLYVDDLKYGWGLVEAKENWQLLGYAIGEVIRRQTAFEKIVMRIHQPRPHHEDGPTREWVITYEELLGFKEQIESRMDKISKGFDELVTGPQCRYCVPTRGNCTAFNRSFYSTLDYVLSDFRDDTVDEKRIGQELDLLERATEILKIKNESMKQLAVEKIRSGKLIPGYACEDSLGDRKWKAEVSPLVIETLTGKDITEKVMLSPAKAEKIGVPKDLIATLVDRAFLGQKLKRYDANKQGNKIFGGIK